MADIILPGSLAKGPLSWLYSKIKSAAKFVLALHRTKISRGDHFTILVAILERDDDDIQRSHILHSLERQFQAGDLGKRMEVKAYPRKLTLGYGERGEMIAAAEKKGRAWLEHRKADVLIWGEVGSKDKVVRLRFTTAERPGNAAKSYLLTDKLELPADFGEEFGAVLAAIAAIAIKPIYDNAGRALAEIIAPIVGKLRPLAANPPDGFSPHQKAQLWHAYAAGEGQLGEERGDNARLATAIQFYGKVLDVWTRERAPLQWATTQNNLGTALSSLGERESGTTRLEEAVEAYREALQERTRERAPLQWATTQTNLGSTLGILGERQAETDPALGCGTLRQAREAMLGALDEYRKAQASYYIEQSEHNLARIEAAIARLCG